MGSCHKVTTSAHSTILQHLLWEHCDRHLAKCKSVRFAKEKYCLCPKVITDFCDRFVFDLSLAYRWVGLKSFGHPIIEFFDKGVGFCWRAYRNLGTSYTCVDLIMGLFADTVGTTTLLTALDKRGITYLATTNAGWLPYLVDEGI